MKPIRIVILGLLAIAETAVARVEVRLRDAQTRRPIADAAVYVGCDGTQSGQGAITMESGTVIIRPHCNTFSISVSHLNYQAQTVHCTAAGDTTISIMMQPSVRTIDEVVVTATESHGVSTASEINRDAMAHLQPSSFSDLTSLIPGGVTKTPNLTSANTIQLREAGNTSADYATSSLGTLFTIDGAPISTDANLQYVETAASASQDASRTTTNKGVDMRNISTDEIEKVEIVRGIPSVEYGDLTSGLVRIERTARATPLRARFKTDGFGKMIYVGKGISMNQSRTVVNLGVDYLNAKADPRNNLENYQRITGSARLNQRYDIGSIWTLKWQSNLDYTGSIDNDKQDPDLNYMREDSYRSQYHSFGWANTLTLRSDTSGILRSLTLLHNLNYQANNIRQTRYVALDRDRAMPTGMTTGEHDGQYLPYTYVATHEVDGKPLNSYLKLKADLLIRTGQLTQKIIAGAEWTYNKNFGRGQVFDLTRPLTVGTIVRPRDYWSIP
ncbi:MAG: TonB-dependent receptor plug domain-containing protein, partial [Paludibacteraceae bacterium]|nr:TonB-dependent receptor plug domain-containing protein [Paludibacteraceae bacterium]